MGLKLTSVEWGLLTALAVVLALAAAAHFGIVERVLGAIAST
jgi:hypothetical protein